MAAITLLPGVCKRCHRCIPKRGENPQFKNLAFFIIDLGFRQDGSVNFHKMYV